MPAHPSILNLSVFLSPPLNIWLIAGKDFTITAGSPKLYLDKQTDSGKDLSRHFCDNCGSSVYVTTPLNEQIVSVPVGTLDGSEAEWVPNKGQLNP